MNKIILLWVTIRLKKELSGDDLHPLLKVIFQLWPPSYSRSILEFFLSQSHSSDLQHCYTLPPPQHFTQFLFWEQLWDLYLLWKQLQDLCFLSTFQFSLHSPAEEYSWKWSGDGVALMALNIKGCVARAISDIKGWGWSGLMGYARQRPWLQTGVV